MYNMKQLYENYNNIKCSYAINGKKMITVNQIKHITGFNETDILQILHNKGKINIHFFRLNKEDLLMLGGIPDFIFISAEGYKLIINKLLNKRNNLDIANKSNIIDNHFKKLLTKEGHNYKTKNDKIIFSILYLTTLLEVKLVKMLEYIKTLDNYKTKEIKGKLWMKEDLAKQIILKFCKNYSKL